MNTFEQFRLRPEILAALDEIGFTQPTPIQQACIDHLVHKGGDIVALAPTGTGKTAAFSLPLLQQIDTDQKAVQAIILCPTRELCLQITKDIKLFSKNLKGVRSLAVYGGEHIGVQLRGLRDNPQIIVGTPGRVLDLISRKKLILDEIQWLVLDEADEMLNMGFKDDMDAILEQTPSERKTLLFSATMPRSVAAIAKNYMNKPHEVKIEREKKAVESIEHQYAIIHAKDRYLALRRIVDATPDIYGIIFCRTKRETAEVADKLIQHKYSAEALHGDIAQEQRTHIMNRFRKKQIQLLVATDVAARGIDVNDLTHVLNYNLPDALETYVHRSGRTGRADKNGVSLILLNMREKNKVRMLERVVEKPFKRIEIPTGKEVCKKQMFHLIKKVSETSVNKEEIAPYLDSIYEQFNGLTKEEVIQHFISVEFNRFIEIYKDAPDLNAQDSRRERTQHGTGQYSNFRINLGERDRFSKKLLFELINKQNSLKGADIGRINMKDSVTFIEIDRDFEKEVLEELGNAQYKGKKIDVQLDKGRPGGGGGSERRSFRGGKRKDHSSRKGGPRNSSRRKQW